MQPETSEVQSFRPLLAQAAARFHSCRAAELEASEADDRGMLTRLPTADKTLCWSPPNMAISSTVWAKRPDRKHAKIYNLYRQTGTHLNADDTRASVRRP